MSLGLPAKLYGKFFDGPSGSLGFYRVMNKFDNEILQINRLSGETMTEFDNLAGATIRALNSPFNYCDEFSKW